MLKISMRRASYVAYFRKTGAGHSQDLLYGVRTNFVPKVEMRR